MIPIPLLLLLLLLLYQQQQQLLHHHRRFSTEIAPQRLCEALRSAAAAA